MECKIVGSKIAALRKKQNKTQKQLAEELGVTNKAVSKWETGEGYPDITLLPDISFALEISIDELLDNDPSSERTKQEFLESVEKRKEYAKKQSAVKNSTCYAFLVLLAGFLIAVARSGIEYLKLIGDGVENATYGVYFPLDELLIYALPLSVCIFIISYLYQRNKAKRALVK